MKEGMLLLCMLCSARIGNAWESRNDKIQMEMTALQNTPYCTMAGILPAATPFGGRIGFNVQMIDMKELAGAEVSVAARTTCHKEGSGNARQWDIHKLPAREIEDVLKLLDTERRFSKW